MPLPNRSLVLALPRLSPMDLIEGPAIRTLARGTHRHNGEPGEVVDRLLRLLGRALPTGGRAALRFLGQTGTAPTGWITAADPVHLETCIDHLRVHALAPASVAVSDLQSVFARLQDELGESGALTFRAVGGAGYIEAPTEALDTPRVSALAVDGCEPSRFMPDGTDGGGGQSFHRLLSEVQMVLHEAGIAARDPEQGTLTVNALWIWGGGRIPTADTGQLPGVYSDDDLVNGFWRAAGAEPNALPQTLAECLAADAAPRVVVSVGADSTFVEQAVELLKEGRVRRLLLLLADGHEIDLRRADRFRFWRRAAPELDVRRDLR